MLTNRPLNVFRYCLLPSVRDSSQTTGIIICYGTPTPFRYPSLPLSTSAYFVYMVWLAGLKHCICLFQALELWKRTQPQSSNQKHLKTSTITVKSWLKNALVLHLCSYPLLQKYTIRDPPLFPVCHVGYPRSQYNILNPSGLFSSNIFCIIVQMALSLINLNIMI